MKILDTQIAVAEAVAPLRVLSRGGFQTTICGGPPVTPFSFSGRTPDQLAEISREMRALYVERMFADTLDRLTDPTLVAMTSTLRAQVLDDMRTSPLSAGARDWLRMLASGEMPAHELDFAYDVRGKAWRTGQELLDAGLVARTVHAGGSVTFRLTAKGRRWGAVA